MRLSNFFIESIGLYLPECHSTESAVADGRLDAGTREKSGWTGTAVAGDISAPDMAIIAIKEALSRSRYTGDDVALMLYGSSGMQGIPPWPAHHYVQRKAVGGTAAAIAIDASLMATIAMSGAGMSPATAVPVQPPFSRVGASRRPSATANSVL